MKKLDRFQQLHRLLESHRRPVPLHTIAERLECSARTAHRLIDDMRLYFNAPLEYFREENGWHYAPEAGKYELPGLWLTGDELLSLALLLGLLENLGDGLLGRELGVVERRIHRLLEARNIDPHAFGRHFKVLPMAARQVPASIFQRVGEALVQRRRLAIRYDSYARRITRRVISPQTLVYYRDNWYLDAWCHLRDELRVFALARIVSMEMVDEDAIEVPTEDLRRHFGSAYGMFAGAGTHLARLRFLPRIAREISLQQWHPEQQGEWDGDQYILSFPYNRPDELIGDILRHVPHVLVEEPPELRRAVRDRLLDGLAQYD